jgi:hypothetical protein
MTIHLYAPKDSQDHKVGRVTASGSASLTRERRVRSSALLPKEEAVACLRQKLHARIEQRQRTLRAEFTVLEALFRMGELDAAAHALEDQRLALQAFHTDLEAVIADATAEQAAERALEAWQALPVTVGADERRKPAGRGLSSRPRLALTLAAAMLGLVLVPGLREQPLRMFLAREAGEAHEERAAWSEIHAARERLATLEPSQADAEDIAAETRAVHDRILSFPDSALASKALQAEIRGLLAEQSGALRDLQSNPDAKSLLGEVRALSASLGLGVPEPRVQPPPPASEIPLPRALEQAPPQQPAPEQLAPEPEKPVTDLQLPEQQAPAPPDTGNLDVHGTDAAAHPYSRTPDGPKPALQP